MQEKVAKEQGNLFISFSQFFISSLSQFLFPCCSPVTEPQNHRITKVGKDLQDHQVVAEKLCFPQGNETIHMASFLMPLAPDKMTFSISLQALQRESNTPWESFGSAAYTCHAERGLGK